MFITVNQINKVNNYNNFKAHPDFVKLSQNYGITASSYFRRGPAYGCADENFQDIINIFKKIFHKIEKPLKMLIVGIGNSQEPFSYLATIKDIINNKEINDVLDLNIVDLQSKPDKNKLFKNSYFEYSHVPDFAQSSFVKDIKPNIVYNTITGYYRVKDDIFNYLNKTYSNNNKSKWSSRIQESIVDFNNSEFDIISINNTLGYIIDKEERINTLQNIYRVLKKNKILITDPNHYYIEQAGLLNKFNEISLGIYEKK